MKCIEEIDSNFAIKTTIKKDDIIFYDIDEQPFMIHGIFKENGKYRRMPENIAKNISKGVFSLHTHTAGGRVRFSTDSCYVAIHAVMDGVSKMPHFACTGSIGFDLYEKESYIGTFVPPFDVENKYEGIIEFGNRKCRDITINFPLYSTVSKLYIGLQKNSVIEKPSQYSNREPIVYYGSSITQGGCASRPGMSYPAIISRKFDCDYINLGFSGNAKAEDEMIDHIKSLDMSIFVFDYDHNSPNTEHLKATHEKMFKEIRKVHQKLPIILMSRPKYILTKKEEERRKIIETTYKNARSKGDEKVYFLDGRELTAYCKDAGTVDNCHPTDFGFFSMSEALSKVIQDNCLLKNELK